MSRGLEGRVEERRIRVLVAKPGLDGHDQGAKVVVHALRDAGFEVIYTGLHQTVEHIAKAAAEEDVDVIGISILSGAHLPLCERLVKELKSRNLSDRLLVVGGNIPDRDVGKLKTLGVHEVFPTGSAFETIVLFIRENAPKRGSQ